MIRKSLVLAASLLAVPAFAQTTAPGTGSTTGSASGGTPAGSSTGSMSAGTKNDHAMAGHSMGASGSMAMGDKEILQQVHMTNQMEIEMGKLGKSQAKSKAVKDYAAKMVKDHTAADKLVMETAKKEKLTLDATAKTPDEKAMRKQMDDQMASLKKLKGDEFDKQYLTAMVDGHTQAVTMLEGAQGKGMPDTNALVAKLLPQVQAHKDLAVQLQGQLGSSVGSGSK